MTYFRYNSGYKITEQSVLELWQLKALLPKTNLETEQHSQSVCLTRPAGVDGHSLHYLVSSDRALQSIKMEGFKHIPVRLGDFSVIDQEFNSIRERFDSEMKKMEEEMTRFRNELMNREASLFQRSMLTSSR